MKGANPGQARKVDQNTKAYPGKLFPGGTGCKTPAPKGKGKGR